MCKEDYFRSLNLPFDECERTVTYCKSKCFNLFNHGVKYANEWFDITKTQPPRFTNIICKDIFKGLFLYKIIDEKDFKSFCTINGIKYWKFVERN